MSKKGILIVIEGTDGSGKKTQAGLLCARLKKEGYKIARASFPQYGKKSAGLIEEYLCGAYGPADKLNPYIASLFFALDRFDLSQKIRRWRREGRIVIMDRYTDSNAAHQGGKIRDPKKRGALFRWLYDLEYGILEIPRPDKVLILHVPAAIGQKLAAGRAMPDQHEKSLAHLSAAEKSYLSLGRKFPRDHVIVECMEKDVLLPPEKVHAKIWDLLEPLLTHARHPDKNSRSSPAGR
jgi:dTMP kinase